MQEEFLHRVFREELAHRERLRKTRKFQRAAFPVRKTLEAYEWTSLRLPSTLHQDELTSCQFVQDKKNLILYGPVGTGKSHLAIALGVRACEMEIETRFFTAASLVTRLSESKRAGQLERTLKDISKAECRCPRYLAQGDEDLGDFPPASSLRRRSTSVFAASLLSRVKLRRRKRRS